jgi:MFS superfamily sulfate permease-like transporter
MLGTGKQLAIGPTSAISMLIGVTLAELSNGDIQRWVDLASLSALLFAGMSLIAYLIRLSSVINFISETVLVGFKAGAAITIGLTQLPKLLGCLEEERVFSAGLLFFLINCPKPIWLYSFLV